MRVATTPLPAPALVPPVPEPATRVLHMQRPGVRSPAKQLGCSPARQSSQRQAAARHSTHHPLPPLQQVGGRWCGPLWKVACWVQRPRHTGCQRWTPLAACGPPAIRGFQGPGEGRLVQEAALATLTCECPGRGWEGQRPRHARDHQLHQPLGLTCGTPQMLQGCSACCGAQLPKTAVTQAELCGLPQRAASQGGQMRA